MQDLKGDREVVLEAVTQDGRARQSASKELRRDRDVVTQAIKQTCLGACVRFREAEVGKSCPAGAHARVCVLA